MTTVKKQTKFSDTDDHYQCNNCQFTCSWSNKDYRERGNPVCPDCGIDMELDDTRHSDAQESADYEDSKLFIGIEYSNDPDSPESTTYEIFDSVEDALQFREHIGSMFKYAFVADVRNYYLEKADEDFKWNYDDELDTLNNQLIIELK